MTANENRLTSQVLDKAGLQLSDKKINAAVSPDALVYEFRQLAGVYIMENDLYGNVMPEDSCFLAFEGAHGLMGKHLKLDTLMTSSLSQIRELVAMHNEG